MFYAVLGVVLIVDAHLPIRVLFLDEDIGGRGKCQTHQMTRPRQKISFC